MPLDVADAAPKEAGAPEIKVTPAMLEAGAEEFLRWSGGAVADIGNESVAAECIFKAMISTAGQG